MTTIDPLYAALPPLGEGLPLRLELKEAPPSSVMNIPTRSRAHLEEASQKGTSSVASNNNLTSLSMSPPPTPPRLVSQSPVASRKSSFGRMQSMDDSYCDRIRSASSFGWYDESTAFESIDVPHSNFRQIEDWRDLDTWDGGRAPKPEEGKDAPDVEFHVPNAHVTTTKTFRHASHGRPEPYAIAIGGTRVIRVSPVASHAEFQVLMSTKDNVYNSWKRFSDFKLLAEYAKISDLRDTVKAWTTIQQTQRWFRCLEANYLKTKCMLLEKFMAQLLFEVPTPSLLLTFVGAHQPDFVRKQ